jgi:hypothetical protein
VSYDEARCHCSDDTLGHPPGEGGCGFEVKPVRVVPFRNANPPGPGAARGTCPECGRPDVTVRRHQVKAGKVPLGVEPQLAAHQVHRRRGVACPGAGRPPAELRFVPSQLVVDWIAVHGRESVA